MSNSSYHLSGLLNSPLWNSLFPGFDRNDKTYNSILMILHRSFCVYQSTKTKNICVQRLSNFFQDMSKFINYLLFLMSTINLPYPQYVRSHKLKQKTQGRSQFIYYLLFLMGTINLPVLSMLAMQTVQTHAYGRIYDVRSHKLKAKTNICFPDVALRSLVSVTATSRFFLFKQESIDGSIHSIRASRRIDIVSIACSNRNIVYTTNANQYFSMSDSKQSIVSVIVDRRHLLNDSLSSDDEHYQTAHAFADNDGVADNSVGHQHHEATASPWRADRDTSFVLNDTYENWPVASKHPSWPSPSASSTSHNSNNSSLRMPASSSQQKLVCSTPVIRYAHLPLHSRPQQSPELQKLRRPQPTAPVERRRRTDSERHESNVRYLNRILGPLSPMVKRCNPADLLPRVNIDLPKEGLETRVMQLPINRRYGIRL